MRTEVQLASLKILVPKGAGHRGKFVCTKSCAFAVIFFGYATHNTTGCPIKVSPGPHLFRNFSDRLSDFMIVHFHDRATIFVVAHNLAKFVQQQFFV
jgi:hypothetical protein